MKKICFSSVILFSISMVFLLSGFAQDTPQWHLPEGAKARIGKGAVEDIALSPDGEQLAVATGIGIWLYNAQTGAEIALLTGYTDWVTAVAYSPDGQTLAGGSYREIRFWDPKTQAHKSTLMREETRSLVYSPDGKTLAVGRWEGVDVLDAETDELKLSLSGHLRGVRALAFSSDSKRLVTASDSDEDPKVRLWNAGTGKRLRLLGGHTRSLHSLMFSPDDKTVVGGARDDTFRVWNPNTGANTRTVREWSDSLAYSPDGKKIVISQGGDLVVLNANTGTLQQRLTGHTNGSHSLVFSSDSDTLVSASWDGTIRFWNIGTGSLRLTVEGHFGFRGFALAPNGETLATANENQILFWNTENGQFKRALDVKRRVRTLAYSPDGKTLAIATWDEGPQVRLLNANTGQTQRALRWEEGDADSIAFSPDGQRIASAGHDEGIIRVWNAQNGKLQHELEGHREGIESLVFSRDGKKLASGGRDRTVHLWNPQNGKLQHVLEGHEDEVRALAFSADGSRLVSGSRDKLRFWNPQNGHLQRAFERDGTRAEALALSPDGKTLAAASWRVIHLRNARNGEIQQVLPISTGVRWLGFTSDSQTLIIGGHESTILLRDTDTFPEPIAQDLNSDGVIDKYDLIAVAEHFGQFIPGDAQPNPDIDGDGVVSSQDVLEILVLLDPEAFVVPEAPGRLTVAERLRYWIHHMKQLDNTDEGFQRGIQVLEALLATLGTQPQATPAKTALLPNYPNPFNPETWIPYELATPADVKITIYDAKGGVVRTLELGHQPEGYYTEQQQAVYWDGRNTAGERVASGVYYYQLQTDTVSLTRKMVILK